MATTKRAAGKRAAKTKSTTPDAKPKPAPAFEYTFPSIRGVQAQREYYVSMVPIRLVPRIFPLDEDDIAPELRAQRTLSKGRIPKIAGYILANPTTYVFSSLTASIDGQLRFVPIANGARLGTLHVPMNARFMINDGQHRRAAIEAALRENRDLGDETISVVFFLDINLERSQQMFADLNRNATKPSKTIGILYDHRDPMAIITKRVILNSPLFAKLVEMERTTPGVRSQRLFTLGAFYSANQALLSGFGEATLDDNTKRATVFWHEVAKYFPHWKRVQEGKLAAKEVRRDYLHAHGVVIHALGRAGNALLRTKAHWKRGLRAIADIDWSRTNTELWEGRAMIGGRICKSDTNVILTANVIKRQLGLDFSPEEARIEKALSRSRQ